jgi:hypothetical protein
VRGQVFLLGIAPWVKEKGHIYVQREKEKEEIR